VQRLFLSLATAVLGCLAIPANLAAQDAAESYNNRGIAFEEKGDYGMAIASYNMALAVDPNYYDPYCNRGNCWVRKGEYDKAIADYDEALAINPNLPAAYADRSTAWDAKGEYDKAIADCDQALALSPNGEFGAAAYSNRGNAWWHKAEYDKAIADYNQALAMKPNLAEAYHGRGNAWKGKGQYGKALADYNQALAVNPNAAYAYNALGSLYAICPDEKYRDGKKAFENASKAYQLDGGNHWIFLDTLAAVYEKGGDFAAAKQWHAKAIALAAADKSVNDNDKADAYSSVAWFQATCPDEKYRDGKKAFENASKAYQLSGGKNWNTLDTLAAAYAESGDFDSAKQWQAKAIELAASDKSATDRDKAKASLQLELYKQNKPYREELKRK
jgi:tetratricopeptide (TPR) repeat protein